MHDYFSIRNTLLRTKPKIKIKNSGSAIQMRSVDIYDMWLKHIENRRRRIVSYSRHECFN